MVVVRDRSPSEKLSILGRRDNIESTDAQRMSDSPPPRRYILKKNSPWYQETWTENSSALMDECHDDKAHFDKGVYDISSIFDTPIIVSSDLHHAYMCNQRAVLTPVVKNDSVYELILSFARWLFQNGVWILLVIMIQTYRCKSIDKYAPILLGCISLQLLGSILWIIETQQPDRNDLHLRECFIPSGTLLE